MRKLIFILVESSVELLPSIGDLRQRYRASPKIFDLTYHHSIIRKKRPLFKNLNKRGRPDIIHRALLTILDSPLKEIIPMEIYLHTIDGQIFAIKSETRLPRNYIRFLGLMEQLLLKHKIPPDSKDPLMRRLDLNLGKLLNKIANSETIVIGFSRRGKYVPNLLDYLKGYANKFNIIVNLVGGFPKGTFSESTIHLLDEMISVSKKSLSTSAVICRIVTYYEHILTQLRDMR